MILIGEIAWEEFEKVGLQHLANLHKKKAEMAVTYMTRFNKIQGTR